MSKRIAVVTHASQLEGAERSLLAVLDYLKNSRGWSMIVAVCMDGEFNMAIEEMGIPFRKFGYPWWQTEGESIATKWSAQNVAVADEMVEMFKEFGADLVYTNTSVVGVGALVAAKIKKPHVWHIRELASGNIFDKQRLAMPAIGAFMAATSNKVLFNSRATQMDWSTLLGDEVAQEVVYNQMSVLPILKRLEHTGFVMAVVGSVLPIKNQGAVIDALGDLLQLYPDVSIRLKIIGPLRKPAYHEALLAKALALDVSEHIEWLGFQENPWLVAADADLIVIPGNKEGFGRVCAEAMMQGLPVLAAAGGATDELVIQGETGFLYHPENTGLAKEISHLIDDPILRDSCLTKGRAHLLTLTTLEQTFEKLEAQLLQAIQMKPVRPDLSQLLSPYRPPSRLLKQIKQGVKKMIGR